MARLTRTQKYADLREQISNDREASVYTNDLEKYENRLKNIQNNVTNNSDDILNKVVIEEPKRFTDVFEELKEEVKEVTPVKEEKPVIEEKPVEEKNLLEDDKDFLNFLNSLDITNIEKDVEENISKVNVVEEEPIQEVETEVVKEEVKETAEEVITEVKEEVEPIKEEPVIIDVPAKEEEVVNNVNEDYDAIAKIIEEETTELIGVVEPVKEEVKPEPVKEEVKEIPSIPDDNSFIDDILKEAEEYNRQDGRTTISELSDSMVDAVRHPETKVEDSNDEFSNTVSLEISKVLNEIKIEQPTPKTEVVIEEAIAPVEEVNPEEFAEKLASTFEHPTLAKALEEEPIEIKSMEETLRQDVLEDTIPFVMDNQEEVEDFEDEAPNKVLNIILVILIIILLAILGVIVYYILYAKGIIG